MAARKTKSRLKRQNGQWVHPVANVSLAAMPWDHGATGLANRAGLVVEERGEVDPATGKVTNPNRVTGARRVDMIEVYRKRGWISERGAQAAVKLRLAWLATEKGQCAPWLRERVDSTPKPDAAIAIQIDRLSKLIRLGSVVPARDKRIVECVAYHGSGIGALPEYRNRKHEQGKTHLAEAFERLADAIEKVA